MNVCSNSIRLTNIFSLLRKGKTFECSTVSSESCHCCRPTSSLYWSCGVGHYFPLALPHGSLQSRELPRVSVQSSPQSPPQGLSSLQLSSVCCSVCVTLAPQLLESQLFLQDRETAAVCLFLTPLIGNSQSSKLQQSRDTIVLPYGQHQEHIFSVYFVTKNLCLTRR